MNTMQLYRVNIIRQI